MPMGTDRYYGGGKDVAMQLTVEKGRRPIETRGTNHVESRASRQRR